MCIFSIEKMFNGVWWVMWCHNKIKNDKNFRTFITFSKISNNTWLHGNISKKKCTIYFAM